MGRNYSGCLTFGKNLCNRIKECIGFSINKRPNSNNDIVYYSGSDTTCIEAQKHDAPLWDFYLRTVPGNQNIQKQVGAGAYITSKVMQ